MNKFELLSISHFLVFSICLCTIIFLPRLFRNSDQKVIDFFSYLVAFLIFFHQIRVTFVDIVVNDFRLADALPLHLCDFSALIIASYLITKQRYLFVFAFFWGVTGAGMSILTPDAEYAFPAYDYLNTMYGHSLILLGVSIALTLHKERPFLNDIPKLIFYSSILLAAIYGINELLDTNYWYLNDRPHGTNIISLMPDPPIHMLVLYPVAICFIYFVYLPFYLQDKRQDFHSFSKEVN